MPPEPVDDGQVADYILDLYASRQTCASTLKAVVSLVSKPTAGDDVKQPGK